MKVSRKSEGMPAVEHAPGGQWRFAGGTPLIVGRLVAHPLCMTVAEEQIEAIGMRRRIVVVSDKEAGDRG